jgi:two-component system cell cycle response regulator
MGRKEMSVQGLDKSVRDEEVLETVSPMFRQSSTKVVSMDRGQSAPKETLTAALDAALRSADPELDEILSALEEIAKGLKSGAYSAPNLENALQRAASCALRQSLMDREIRSLAVTDELTGLYNRRGFLAAAPHQLKVAHRQGVDALLLFCDVDNLKQINDSFGHREGDLALVRAADALEETFRDCDIMARLSGDEFAVLALDASSPSKQAMVPRIEKSLEKANAEELCYTLSFSIGMARFDPRTPTSLGELMARADQEMYAHKKTRRELRFPRRP